MGFGIVDEATEHNIGVVAVVPCFGIVGGTNVVDFK